MAKPWQPCAIGEPLYRAAAAEAEREGDTLLTLATRPAWFAWVAHRDGCDTCGIERVR